MERNVFYCHVQKYMDSISIEEDKWKQFHFTIRWMLFVKWSKMARLVLLDILIHLPLLLIGDFREKVKKNLRCWKEIWQSSHRPAVDLTMCKCTFSCCSLIPTDVLCSRWLLQEDAEALWRDTGQTGSGADFVRARRREGRDRASVWPCRGTEMTLGGSVGLCV